MAIIIQLYKKLKKKNMKTIIKSQKNILLVILIAFNHILSAVPIMVSYENYVVLISVSDPNLFQE